MKVLHTIAGLGKHSGGTSTCTYELVRALNQNGCATDILTALPGGKNDVLVGDDPFIHAIDARYQTAFCYSGKMRRAIKIVPNITVSFIPMDCGWMSTTIPALWPVLPSYPMWFLRMGCCIHKR